MEMIFTWVYLIIDNAVLLLLFTFILAVLNSFFPVIPLETLTVLGGYLTGTGHGNPVIIWLAATIGMIIGNLMLFQLVRSQGEYLLRWRFINKQLTPKTLEQAEIWIRRYGVWAFYILKLIPGMSFPIIFCCGILKIPYRLIFPATVISNLILYGALLELGRYAGAEWQSVLSRYGKFAFWSGIVLIILVFSLIGVYQRYWRGSKSDGEFKE